MIDYATYCQIRSLYREKKLSVRQIGRRLKLSKKTVRKWIAQEFTKPERPDAPASSTHIRSTSSPGSNTTT
jgi:DNA-binding transcriptional regulator YiaG